MRAGDVPPLAGPAYPRRGHRGSMTVRGRVQGRSHPGRPGGRRIICCISICISISRRVLVLVSVLES